MGVDLAGREQSAAVALRDARCRYQWAWTLILIGGQHRFQGESELAGIGATPVVWPVEQCRTAAFRP